MAKSLVIDQTYAPTHYWRDVWHYRELIYFLTWRDLIIRYKQTLLGILWTLLRPLFAMLALTLVFGKFARLDAIEPFPYPLLVLSGYLPWQFFSNALTEGSESLISNANLITKIYFPRVIIPIARILVGLFDFLLSLIFLGLCLLFTSFPLHASLLLLPVCLLWVTLFSLGVVLFISALNVKYRDFKYIIPFCLQFGLYITPVGFSLNLLPENWKWIFSLNPLVGIVDLFRFAILGNTYPLYPPALILSLIATLAILWKGIRYFRQVEQSFADLI